MTLTSVDGDDSDERLAERVAAQRAKPGFALDGHFYRSRRVYRKELDGILYKSWLYAGHVSQIANPGDYFLYDLGEDSIIIARDPRWCGACADEHLPPSGRPRLRGSAGPSDEFCLPLPRLDVQLGRQPQGCPGDGREAWLRAPPATA